ncbi:MAG: NAD-dependent epimerase/dehydratase family protein [Bacillota bacterium]
MRRFLITGACGFIGYHLSILLLKQGDHVVGYDSMNNYYDPKLKQRRLSLLREHPKFSFILGDLEDRALVRKTMKEGEFSAVINLAAQAGVRYSLEHPDSYIASNLVGFFNVLDAFKEYGVPHLLYASSSSVYGANTKLPFSTEDRTDNPVSLYAATKKCNEILAYSYSHMFGSRATGLRFFTVYGPYGRPDMALFKFTKAILAGEPIVVYNNGDMQRDFTYVDDIVRGIALLIDRSRVLQALNAPHHVYNIGNQHPIELMEFICAIEDALHKKAIIRFSPMQPGDIKATYADTSDLRLDTGFVPNMQVREGIARFVKWYLDYYEVYNA